MFLNTFNETMMLREYHCTTAQTLEDAFQLPRFLLQLPLKQFDSRNEGSIHTRKYKYE